MFYPPNPEVVAAVLKLKGYTVFDGEGYDLNLVGIRTADFQANRFNDWIGVLYRADQQWSQFFFRGTTDPGTYWRTNPMNVAGTAVLKPGQYRRSHRLGKHGGYEALQQAAPLVVYRDADRSTTLEVNEAKTQTGMFGINIHRASATGLSKSVDKWSAGCQVVQDPLHFQFLMDLVRASARVHGDLFSYTLLEERDFPT